MSEQTDQLTPEQARQRITELTEVREAKARIRELQGELERRQREESIKYYVPHDKQRTFHHDDSRIRLVLGGNRSGKTQAGCSEDLAHAIGYRPWIEEGAPGRDIDVAVPNKGLVVGESFGEQVKKVVVPKLLGDPERGTPGVIPKALVSATKKNQQGIITFIKLANGSTITFQSYDQETDLFEGTDFDWVHFDEPAPRDIWVAVQRGLTDRMGRCWMTMTPLKEAWIYDELVSRDDVGKHFFDINDNVGFGLTAQGVKEFEANLTEDEKEARLRGRFFHLTGLVYKAYGDVHRIPRIPVERHWGLWMHIDSHPRTPHHAVWIAVRPDGTLIVVGELKNSHATNLVGPFAEACLVYENKFLEYPSDQVVRLIDPSSQVSNPTKDGRSIWDEFADHGVRCRPGSKNRDSGILLMQRHLQYDPEAGTYPLIYFFDDLRGIDKEMRHYIWEDWSGKQNQSRTPKQVPKDKDDHFIEGMHRILIDEPRWESTVEALLESMDDGAEGSITGY